MLKTLQLVGDSQDWEALWTSRPVCFSLHHMGTSLPAAPPIEPTPQVSPLSPDWALRLRRHVESSEITQSLVSRTLNSSPSWNVEESSCPSAWGFSLRTVLLLTCHPPGPLGSPSVALHGQHRHQMCAQKELALRAGAWGRGAPQLPGSHMTPDEEGPCREGLSHVWGLQGEWGLEPTRSLGS